MWRPSPAPRPQDAPPRHAAGPERPPGFTWWALRPDSATAFFVPFGWLLHRSTAVLRGRQALLHRATAYGEVPEGLVRVRV